MNIQRDERARSLGLPLRTLIIVVAAERRALGVEQLLGLNQ